LFERGLLLIFIKFQISSGKKTPAHTNLVNLNEIEKYLKGEGGYLVMSDGSTIDVSRSKKEILLRKLLPNKE